MFPETVIGWDVGGAHLKAARLEPDGRLSAVAQVACALWQGLEHLDRALVEARALVGEAPVHAVTMTGEMADCFPDRAAGVCALTAHLAAALGPARTRFLTDGGTFLSPAEVTQAPERVASANWVATAGFVARALPAALLVDIGSTTTDLIPVAGGRAQPAATGDYDRLVAGELVYTGVVRTALMALGPSVRFGADEVPLMAEYFATTADVYRVTGELPPGADLHPAADGGAKDIVASRRRLGRMIGRDLASASTGEWDALAREFRGRQLAQLESAVRRQLAREDLPASAPLVGAGVGRVLVSELARRTGRLGMDLAGLLPAEAGVAAQGADCAPAVAVALLARG